MPPTWYFGLVTVCGAGLLYFAELPAPLFSLQWRWSFYLVTFTTARQPSRPRCGAGARRGHTAASSLCTESGGALLLVLLLLWCCGVCRGWMATQCCSGRVPGETEWDWAAAGRNCAPPPACHNTELGAAARPATGSRYTATIPWPEHL